LDYLPRCACVADICRRLLLVLDYLRHRLLILYYVRRRLLFGLLVDVVLSRWIICDIV